MECPDGWQWISEWEVDTNRAVDALGIPPKSFTNLTGYRYFKFTGIDFSNICRRQKVILDGQEWSGKICFREMGCVNPWISGGYQLRKQWRMETRDFGSGLLVVLKVINLEFFCLLFGIVGLWDFRGYIKHLCYFFVFYIVQWIMSSITLQ